MSASPESWPDLEPVDRRWTGRPVAVVAPGPSLTFRDCAALEGRCRVIAVNDAWARVPWADVLYAADLAWWRRRAAVPAFQGERWTQSVGAYMTVRVGRQAQVLPCPTSGRAIRRFAADHGVRVVRASGEAGLSVSPRLIHHGRPAGFSGYQAINLALLFGAGAILLLGFDCADGVDGAHYFGPHVAPLNVATPYPCWIEALGGAAQDLDRAGVPLINCSRRTAVTGVRRATLEEALDELEVLAAAA